MEKKIRSELLKMTAMMLVLVGLGIYAHDFVITGIKAKVTLNLSIFATFGLAAGLAFRHVFNLRNEVTALKALQVDYGQKSRRPLDPYRQPAVVFQEPELLGQGYRLITEEIGKQENLTISNATVQTLLHDVDQRINDRKSTIIYFSGLMVFLGLLGAFMGLMKTVGSVGDLIGGMDVSGKGGTDSFGKLIEGMKGPLNGMSVGFSSSLFGLMTSMVLGALERCMTSAMKALRNEFEHWLSNLAALEGSQSENGVSRAGQDFSIVYRALELGSKQLKDLRDTVQGGAHITEQTQYAMHQMAQAVTQLSQSVDKVTDPGPLLKPIADVVSELARNQTMMVGQFHGLINMAERDRSNIREMLESMQSSIERQQGLNGPQLHSQLDRMVSLQSEMLEHGPTVSVSLEGLDRRMAMHPGVARSGLLAGAMGRMGSWFSRAPATSNTLENRNERKKLRAELRRMMAAQRKVLRGVERSFGSSISKIELGRIRDQELLARMIAQNDGSHARLTALMDRLQMLDEDNEGKGKDMHLLAGLHGARLEMDVLRRRLDLFQEVEADHAPAQKQTNSGEALRPTGTDQP